MNKYIIVRSHDYYSSPDIYNFSFAKRRKSRSVCLRPLSSAKWKVLRKEYDIESDSISEFAEDARTLDCGSHSEAHSVQRKCL